MFWRYLPNSGRRAPGAFYWLRNLLLALTGWGRARHAFYGTLAKYTAAAMTAAESLAGQRLLLQSDVAAAVQSATNQAQQAGLQ